MIVIYINGEGTAEKLSPQHVYQGSNQTGVTIFAPVPTQTSISIAFKLPDKTSTPYYPMTYIQNVEGLAQYEFTIPSSITQEKGEAAIAIRALFSDGQQTSQLVEFEIEESVLPTLPSDIDQDAYDIIMQRLQADRADITTLQGQIGNIEELSEEAQKASAKAVETANDAKTTADGLAANIAQANETAQAAKDVADGAESTANSLAGSIAQANETANNAVDTANGAVQDIAEYKNQINSDVDGLRQDIEGKQFFKGMFNSVEELKAAYPTATQNDYAYIISGNQWIYQDGEWTDSGEPTPNTAVPASTSIPLMDGTGSAGMSSQYARGDHRHPSDTTKVNKSGDTMTGELKNIYNQAVRGYEGLAEGTDLKDKRSGFYDSAYELYTKSIVAGDGGDKFCITWNYNNLPRIQTKVYNSGNLQIDGVIPYIESHKLVPTLENGFTIGDNKLSVPSDGVYLVSVNNSTPQIIVIATIATTSYTSQVGATTVPYGVPLLQGADNTNPATLSYIKNKASSEGSERWRYYITSSSGITMERPSVVAYKKIA